MRNQIDVRHNLVVAIRLLLVSRLHVRQQIIEAQNGNMVASSCCLELTHR